LGGVIGFLNNLPFPVIFAEFHSRQGKRGGENGYPAKSARNFPGKKNLPERGSGATEVLPEVFGQIWLD
jgi:hypothetical protein